jgi:predicted permease
MFWRKRTSRDFRAEIEAHLELETERLKEQGLSEEEARVAARRAFGNVTRAQERFYERGRWLWWDYFMKDLRFGLRQLRRNPALTAVIALSLALGIGANTAIFSMINAVMLKELPVRAPKQLVIVKWVSGAWPHLVLDDIRGPIWMNDSGQQTSTMFSYFSFHQLRDRNQVFSDVLGFSDVDTVNVRIQGQIVVAGFQRVSGNFYSALGVRPILGRTLADEDERPAASPVAVITYAFWKRSMGLDPSVVGKAVALNGVPFTIVGVTPPEFSGLTVGESPDVFVPYKAEAPMMPQASMLNDQRTWCVSIVGRLKPGISEERARSEADVIFQQGLSHGPNSAADRRETPHIELVSGSGGVRDRGESISQPFFILLALSGVVLLICCANVANLLIARAASRQREFAVRLATGASRRRLIHQLLTESLLLATCGGALSLLFAYWGKNLLVDLVSSGGRPVILDTHLDIRILLFTGTVSLLTGVLFGLAPALRSTRFDLTPAINGSARFQSGEPSRLGLSKVLVISQVALCMLLLTCAGLFVRTLRNLKDLEPGFNREDILLFRIDPAANGYKGAQLPNLYKQLLERIRSVPGVHLVTMSRRGVIGEGEVGGTIAIEGHTLTRAESMVWVNSVGPQFFETMQIPLLLGRGISPQDVENGPKVAVVNERLARQFFDKVNPIGMRFSLKARPDTDFEIVGVVKDTRYNSLRRSHPIVFLSYLQDLNVPAPATFEVWAVGDRGRVVAALRHAAESLDKALPLLDIKTQSEQIDASLVEERFFAEVSSCFGLLPLVLACVGLYGVMAYAVARRTREIGIRVALGADRRTVLRRVLGEGLGLVLVGIVLGVPLALAAARLVSSMLFGVTWSDPVTLFCVSLTMCGVAALACYIPARNASRIDPMVALRYE